jgi:hypothetical protein
MGILMPMDKTVKTCTTITRENVVNLKCNNWIHHVTEKLSNGEPLRYRVGSVKTWKRRPERIEVTLKFGLYGGYRLYDTMIDTGEWHMGDGREHNRV